MDPDQSREPCPSPSDSRTHQHSARTSYSDLEQVLQLESAVYTIERELLQPEGAHSVQRQVLGSVLHRHLSARLSETGLTPERIISRPPILLRNPQVRTSTPVNSPDPPPPPPRQCQSMGPVVVPQPRPCSPTCSEISSIGGEVFEDSENVTDQVFPQELRTPGLLQQSVSIHNSNNMEGCEREIEIKSIALNRLMRNFTLVDVSEASIKTGEFNTEFNKVKDLCNDTVECIEKMLLDHKDSMNQLQIEQWTNQIQVIETTVSKYKVELRQKFTEITKGVDASQASPPASVTADMSNLSLGQTGRRNEKLAEAIELFEQVVAMCGDLSDEVNKITDWDKEADLIVSRTMKKLQSWKKDLKEIVDVNRKLRVIAKANSFTSQEVSIDSAEAYVNKLADDLNETVREVESQDDKRALYTLDTTKADPVKLPTFEGKESEDFTIFKDEVERAFRSNKTNKADQLTKLRDCLKNHPKNLIPKVSTTTIEEAWEVLSKAYGDTQRVMDYYMKAIGELGKFPHKTAGLRSQIEWYIQLESLIKRILELAERDKKLARQAYGGTTLKTIVNLRSNRS